LESQKKEYTKKIIFEVIIAASFLCMIKVRTDSESNEITLKPAMTNFLKTSDKQKTLKQSKRVKKDIYIENQI
jgi:hypothetical protein